MGTSRPDTQSGSIPEVIDVSSRWHVVWARLERTLRWASLPLLRTSLGLVFVWFGGLKVAGVTPVEELIAGTLPFLDPSWLVPALGWFEVVIGLALMIGYRLRWVCAAMVAHLGGTFLTAVTQPAAIFQDGNLLMLTMEGEFVLKNLVLITAGLVVAVWSNGSGSRTR